MTGPCSPCETHASPVWGHPCETQSPARGPCETHSPVGLTPPLLTHTLFVWCVYPPPLPTCRHSLCLTRVAHIRHTAALCVLDSLSYSHTPCACTHCSLLCPALLRCPSTAQHSTACMGLSASLCAPHSCVVFMWPCATTVVLLQLAQACKGAIALAAVASLALLSVAVMHASICTACAPQQHTVRCQVSLLRLHPHCVLAEPGVHSQQVAPAGVFACWWVVLRWAGAASGPSWNGRAAPRGVGRCQHMPRHAWCVGQHCGAHATAA